MSRISVLAHNIRSTHNVGAILRTCDGFGIEAFYATGYTPYPAILNDSRLPHERDRATRQIAKTALGAETTVPVFHAAHASTVIDKLKKQGYTIAALEQTPTSVKLPLFQPTQNMLLLLGEEVHGITSELLALCDVTLEIPMAGQKESFNVGVAAGIALYALAIQKP